MIDVNSPCHFMIHVGQSVMHSLSDENCAASCWLASQGCTATPEAGFCHSRSWDKRRVSRQPHPRRSPESSSRRLARPSRTSLPKMCKQGQASNKKMIRGLCDVGRNPNGWTVTRKKALSTAEEARHKDGVVNVGSSNSVSRTVASGIGC